MTTTPILGLPLMAAAQAQKHVTHNEALYGLDALIQIGVLDRTRPAPPDDAREGDRYILPENARGEWSGKAGLIACFQDGAWRIYEPKAGYLAYVKAERGLVLHDGTGWQPLATALGGGGAAAAVPPGCVAYFATPQAPDGWLKANGAAVSRRTYGALFTAIGIAYGRGDGSTTFNLPDLRGEFLRGIDDERGIDAGRILGTVQPAQIADHVHRMGIGWTANGIYGWQTQAGAPIYGAELASGVPVTGVSGTSQTRSLLDARTSKGEVLGTGETRPRNVALLACIKV